VTLGGRPRSNVCRDKPRTPVHHRLTQKEIDISFTTKALSLLVVLAIGGCDKKNDATVSSTSSATQAPSKQTAAPTEADVRTLLEKYHAVASCLDRSALITHAAENRKLLGEYYEGKSCNKAPEKIDTAACASLGGGYCFPVVTRGKLKGAFAGGRDDDAKYCVVSTPEGLRIDWRCSVGYNAQPLATFKALHAEGVPATFRVRAKVSDYFNYDFRGADKTHFAFELHETQGASIHGYIRRDADDGTKLFELLKDAREHDVTLELAYPKGSEDPSIVAIRRVVALDHRERVDEYGTVNAAAPSSSAPTAK
jgi:hypothetical protein